jgi:hypothetical protein
MLCSAELNPDTENQQPPSPRLSDFEPYAEGLGVGGGGLSAGGRVVGRPGGADLVGVREDTSRDIRALRRSLRGIVAV